VKNGINPDNGELSFLMCGALFPGPKKKKDEYLCSILEVVPSFVILCHLLQPVFHLLLRLAVAAAFVVVPSSSSSCDSPSPPPNSSSRLLSSQT